MLFRSIVELLYSNAVLNSGFVLENPSEYADKVNKMIEVGFCDVEDPPDLSDAPDRPAGVDGESPSNENKMEEVD